MFYTFWPPAMPCLKGRSKLCKKFRGQVNCLSNRFHLRKSRSLYTSTSVLRFPFYFSFGNAWFNLVLRGYLLTYLFCSFASCMFFKWRLRYPRFLVRFHEISTNRCATPMQRLSAHFLILAFETGGTTQTLGKNEKNQSKTANRP